MAWRIAWTAVAIASYATIAWPSASATGSFEARAMSVRNVEYATTEPPVAGTCRPAAGRQASGWASAAYRTVSLALRAFRSSFRSAPRYEPSSPVRIVKARSTQPRAPSALMNCRSWVWRPAKKTVSARVSQIRWVIWRKVLAVVPSSVGSAGEVKSCGS